MKSLVPFLVFSHFSIFCFAQKNVVFPIDATSNKVTFSQIVDVENKTKAQLYSDAQKWMAAFNTSNNLKVIQSFENDGEIIAQGIIKVKCSDNSLFSSCEGCRDYDLVYTLNVFVKENKFKFEITNFILQYQKGKSAMGMAAYGVVAGNIKDNEIIAKNFEEFYPIKKKACKDSWNAMFITVDEGISNVISSFTIALKKKEENW